MPNSSKIIETNNVNDTIKFIYSSPLITELGIGSPSQKVNFIIRPTENSVYFTSTVHNTSKNDETTKIDLNKYGQLNNFNENKSTTFSYEKTPYIDSYFYCNFNKASLLKDYLRFNNDKIELNTSFILGYSLQYDEPGAIGLQIAEETRPLVYTTSLLYTLKYNKIIDNYKWFIYFDKKQKNDYLVIGCEPYEFINPSTSELLYKNFDIENDYFTINDEIFRSKQSMQIKFDNIYNKNTNYVEIYKDGQLYYNMGINVGTVNYQKYIENNYLKTYIDNKQCFKEFFTQRANYIHEDYYYYYCVKSIYNDLKNSFNTIYFRSSSLNEDFELNFNDLFIQHNDYIIFLIAFSNHQHFYWDLGTPFTKKYQFAFDFDAKKIMYYKVKNDDDYNQNSWFSNFLSSLFTKIVIILICVSILIVIGIFLGKKLYGLKRKQRANELDEDFEYKEKIDNGGNKEDLLNINTE